VKCRGQHRRPEITCQGTASHLSRVLFGKSHLYAWYKHLNTVGFQRIHYIKDRNRCKQKPTRRGRKTSRAVTAGTLGPRRPLGQRCRCRRQRRRRRPRPPWSWIPSRPRGDASCIRRLVPLAGWVPAVSCSAYITTKTPLRQRVSIITIITTTSHGDPSPVWRRNHYPPHNWRLPGRGCNPQ
jgi:hypothetical protein